MAIMSEVPITQPQAQQQQQTAAGSVDIISQLITSAREADTKAAEAAKAATVPVSGGHMAPQNLVQPGAGRQYKQFDLDTSPVTGRHQANMQGLANLSKSVANVVGQVQQQRDQKKTQELSVNIEHLMGAVQSEDQAKQVLAQDPNNAAAQEQLKKAQAIQGEVLNDDKNRKAIAKAFNINFVDPSKNNTPEHAAMKQATDSYAKQFQNKLPTQMAPNQKAIAEAQSAAAEAKATHDIVGKLAPAIVAAQSREGVEQSRAATAQAVAKTQSQERYNAAVYTADRAYSRAIDGANIHVKGMLTAVKERDNTLLKIASDKIDQLNGVNGKSPKAIQEAQKSFDSISKALEKMPTTIDLIRQERDKIIKENPDSPQIEQYNRRIHFLEGQGNILQLKQEELADRLSNAGEIAVASDATTPPPSGEPNAGNVNYIANADDDNPEDYDQ